MENIFKSFNESIETEVSDVVNEGKAPDNKSITQAITDFLESVYESEKDYKKSIKATTSEANKLKSHIDSILKDFE